jgi:hypothetical protein
MHGRWNARTLLAGAALATMALLTACTTTSGDAAVEGVTSAEMPAAEPGMMADGMAVEGGAPGVVGDASASVRVDRQIVRTGYLTMRVEDVRASAFEIRGLVTRAGGLISSEDVSASGDSAYATITAQVPADRLDAFVADLSELGTVDSITVTASDVTAQAVDLDARIDALQTSIDRLSELLAEASRIEDLLAIETQLSQRQSELDALTAQRSYLADQVALSTITVSLSPFTEIADVDAPGFLSGLQSGWSALVSVVMVAITALGFFLPFLVIMAIIAIPVTIVLVRQSRRRQRAHAAAVPPPAPVVSPETRPEAGSEPRP